MGFSDYLGRGGFFIPPPKGDSKGVQKRGIEPANMRVHPTSTPLKKGGKHGSGQHSPRLLVNTSSSKLKNRYPKKDILHGWGLMRSSIFKKGGLTTLAESQTAPERREEARAPDGRKGTRQGSKKYYIALEPRLAAPARTALWR